ncbi:MAG: LLM class flavin-dependent oxidoreductase [Actinomycetota bacterium]
MRFGLSFPNFGAFARPGSLVRLAVAAEEAGWDGFFVWDHIVVADGVAVADPWVALGAVAQATRRIRIGPMVVALPRRRPWVVARQAATAQSLSQGRFILGVGLGYPPEEEFATFGEDTDARRRAGMLDEGLGIIAGIWSGRPFSCHGEHYRVTETVFAPVPEPPIPIWVAGMIPHRRPFRRGARYDGVFPIRSDMEPVSPQDLAWVREITTSHRTGREGLDHVVGGPPRTEDDYRELEEAGATWYLAGPSPEGESLEDTLTWVRAGPGAYRA